MNCKLCILQRGYRGQRYFAKLFRSFCVHGISIIVWKSGEVITLNWEGIDTNLSFVRSWSMDNWAEIWITNVGCKTKSALSLAQGEFSHTVLTQGQKGDWDTRSTWEIFTISCALALVKLRKPTATGTGFFLHLLLIFHFSSPCALPIELEHG